MAQIPLILHQTYKDERLPTDLVKLQQSWRQHNPHWEHRFWSDEDMEVFIAKHYPTFLPIFHGYPQHIMRVDAFRYFLLYHYGGIYADLDFECLRPMDDILHGKEILLILEPEIHLDKQKPKVRNLDYIVSNALMASVPQHPFWQEVTKRLQDDKSIPDVLDCTGPFMLTAVHYDFTPKISLAPVEQFDSLTSDDSGKVQDSGARQVYARHHWLGSWWKRHPLWQSIIDCAQGAKALIARQLSINYRIRDYVAKLAAQGTNRLGNAPLYAKRLSLDRGWIDRDNEGLQAYDFKQAEKLLAPNKELPYNLHHLPKVSAIMLNKDRPQLVWRAVECFLAQSYPNKELVVIDERGVELNERLQQLGDLKQHGISYHRGEQPSSSTGNLLNLAIQMAQGEYICQWNDTDLYYKHRITYQIAACLQGDASACFLLRQVLLSGLGTDVRFEVGISDYRLWESSILAKKKNMPKYCESSSGPKDYKAVDRLVSKHKVVAIDLPGLYIHNMHSAAIQDDEHIQMLWQRASRQFFLKTDRQEMLQTLAKDYPHLSKIIT